MFSDLAAWYKVSDHSNLKILTPKKIIQRLPKALAQIRTVKTSENLLNEIRKISVLSKRNY